MNREKEIKVTKSIKNADRIRESRISFEGEGNITVRIELARELHEMGLETESIEKILSIRISK
jgi:hypothetical protein